MNGCKQVADGGLENHPVRSSRPRHTHDMTIQPGHPGNADSAKPFLYALFGTALLAIGGMLFVNVDEDPELFAVFTVAFAAPGLYLLIAGAVTRGIFVARR
jgi:hypothetical protein